MLSRLPWRALLVPLCFALLGAECEFSLSTDDEDRDDGGEPRADAGPDRSVPVGSTVVLDGSASRGTSGGTLSFDWTLVTVPGGSTAALTDADTPGPRFTADAAGAYTAELVVRSGGRRSPPDTVTVTAVSGNAAPLARAGPDLAAATDAPIVLDGRASTDAETPTLGFRWRIAQQPPGGDASLSGAQTALPTFTAGQPGTYRVELTVEDGGQRGATDTALVRVERGNAAPNARAGPDRRAAVGRTAILDGRASTDPNGDVITFDWRVIAAPEGSAAVVLDPAVPNPRLVPDRPGLYLIRLVVDDGWRASAPDNLLLTAE